ncbi:hypothetical protein ACP70R_018278 [Stipagrostis hirtigluma subsp. patula]
MYRFDLPPDTTSFISGFQNSFRPCVRFYSAVIARFRTDLEPYSVESMFQRLSDLLLRDCNVQMQQISATDCYIIPLDHTSAERVHSLLHSKAMVLGDIRAYLTTKHELYRFDPRILVRRVIVRINRLPVHLWSKNIIEQLLAPYCGLDYLPEDMHNSERLTTCWCIAWCRNQCALPPTMTVKVCDLSTANPWGLCGLKNTKVNCYNISFTHQEYYYGDPVECLSDSDIKTGVFHVSDTHNAAQCYIYEEQIEPGLLQLYSQAAIVSPVDEDTLISPDIISCLLKFPTRSVSIKDIGQGNFIVLPKPSKFIGVSLCDYLTRDPELCDRLKINVQSWSPLFGSVQQDLSRHIRLTIHDLPCFFNTKEIIQYLLSPYGVPEFEDNIISEESLFFHFRCRLWSDSLPLVPLQLTATILPSGIFASDHITDAPFLQAQIYPMLLTYG